MEPFVALMRQYCAHYVNCHDLSLLPRLMVDDYMLSMGEHTLRGRDGQYANATRIQMTDVPGMLLTVHELLTDGERLAMRFTEHGASRRENGRQAAWAGIALYRWDGVRLTHCRVEQDYSARRRQYSLGIPDRVDAPAVAPWDTHAVAADRAAEAIVRAWLETGAARCHSVLRDDEWLGQPSQDVLNVRATEVLDLFSAGPRVAFHVRHEGVLRDDFPTSGVAGAAVFLHCAGIVEVENGQVVRGRVVRDRTGLQRRLAGRVVSPR